MTWVIRLALGIGVAGTVNSLVDGYWYGEFWVVAAVIAVLAGDGRLLENVHLYDQEGRAVDNVYVIEWDSDCASAADVRPGNVVPRAVG